MPSRSITDRLRDGDVLILDGGTGSELQRRGFNVNKGSSGKRHGAWSAPANLEAPALVREVHEDYLNAGAEIITSNNFYTSRPMLAITGGDDRWEEHTRRGGEIAVQTRDAVNPEAYVAGGIGTPTSGDLRKEFEDQTRVLASTGIDFMIAEYLGGDSIHEDPIADCVTAVDACAVADLPVFLGVCIVGDDGKMMHGESFADLAKALHGHPVDGIFLMCSLPSGISACLPRLREAYPGPIGAYGQIGYEENRKFGASSDEPFFEFTDHGYSVDRYTEYAREWKRMGAQIIGGCCATGPEYIRAITRAFES